MNPRTVALAFSLSLTLLPAMLPAQHRDLRQRVPATAWGYLQFEGLEACRKAFDRLPESKPFRALMKTLKDKGLLQAMDDGLQMGMDKMNAGIGASGHSTAEFRALASRPMVLVVGRPTLIAEGMVPSVLLMVDVAKAENEAKALLSTLATITAAQGNASLVELREPRITIARYRKGPGKVAWTLRDQVLYLSLGAGLLRDTLATSEGKAHAMKLPAPLQKTEASLGAKPELSLYMDLHKIQESLGWLMPYEMLELGRILGIQGIQGYYYGAAATPKGLVEADRLLIPGNPHGLMQRLMARPTQCAAANLAEKDTLLFASARLDTRGLIDAFEQILPLLPPAVQDQVEHGYLQGNKNIEQGIGMDADALAAQFQGEWSLALQAPRGSELLPDLMLFVPVKDADKALSMVQALLRRAPNVKLLDQKVGEETVYIVSLPKKAKSRIPLTPAFTFKNGFMIWGLNARALKNQARHWPTPAESYAGTAAFQHLRKGTHGASSLLFLHLQSGFARLWDNQQLKGLLLMGINENNPGMDLRSEDLPTSAQLAPLLQDTSMAMVWDENGPAGRAENSPLGAARVVVYGGSFLDWFLEGAVANEIR